MSGGSHILPKQMCRVPCETMDFAFFLLSEYYWLIGRYSKKAGLGLKLGEDCQCSHGGRNLVQLADVLEELLRKRPMESYVFHLETEWQPL